jgi:2-keto-4-pentenoate hydratase/2-oxohepta-3-ene-1,7-dioic acid hydratase in catechol pathway
MRIARFDHQGRVGWGAVDGDEVVDMSVNGRSFVDLVAEGADAFLAIPLDGRRITLDDVRLLAPIERPSKIIGLARNYRDHGPAAIAGETPTPILFGMLPSAVIGPGDTIEIPPESSRVDWEVELAVVIGRRARNVPVERALDHVLGYTIVNDISARDPEIVQGQLFRGKAFDTFKPMGPWITTVDELGDGAGLRLELLVNGERKQDSTTSNLIAGVRALIELCSRTFTLEPGDVIATGTPGGTGSSRDPQEFLQPGDEVVARIENIGELRNHVRAGDRGA